MLPVRNAPDVRPGVDSHETWACLQAFGPFPFGFNDFPIVEAEAPDAGKLVGLAARRGYLMWMFRPVRRGIWAPVADDSTLHNDGSRTPPCPLASIPVTEYWLFEFGGDTVRVAPCGEFCVCQV